MNRADKDHLPALVSGLQGESTSGVLQHTFLMVKVSLESFSSKIR